MKITLVGGYNSILVLVYEGFPGIFMFHKWEHGKYILVCSAGIMPSGLTVVICSLTANNCIKTFCCVFRNPRIVLHHSQYTFSVGSKYPWYCGRQPLTLILVNIWCCMLHNHMIGPFICEDQLKGGINIHQNKLLTLWEDVPLETHVHMHFHHKF
jgi:hypothetical protein